MTDVEKYGLGAVVCVLALLALVVLPMGDEEPVPVEGLARPARPVIIGATNPPAIARETPDKTARPPRQQPAATRTAQPAAENPAVAYTVRPLTPQGVPFEWDEEPVAYPGRRSSAEPLAPGETRETIRHTIASGETLGDISARYFGTTTRWEAIRDLNPGLDPMRLKVGQVILVQAAGPVAGRARPEPQAAPREVPPKTAKAGNGSYVVQEGDTLGGIAQKVLGSTRHSDRLYQANRHVLESPDRLVVGQKLVIP